MPVVLGIRQSVLYTILKVFCTVINSFYFSGQQLAISHETNKPSPAVLFSIPTIYTDVFL